jgi:hypothetical protein
MKLTTMTQVTVDGLMQGDGSAEEDDRCRNPRSVSPDHARNRRPAVITSPSRKKEGTNG